MKTSSRMRYVIDVEDRISAVDEEWSRFAEANDGEELMPPGILGQSLWDHITDGTTRTLYRQILSHVRQGKFSVFSLRCDGPACRRHLEMTIRGAPDGSVSFETRALHTEAREPVVLLSRNTAHSTDMVRICAWCNRIAVGPDSDEWVEVEEAMERLHLFERDQMPQLTHAMCERCLASMTGALDRLETDAEAIGAAHTA